MSIKVVVPLTPRDRAILTHLWKHPGASIRELMAGCRIPSPFSVNYRLERLNHLGYIKPRPARSERTNTLTPAGLLAGQGYRLLWWEAE